jgi:hypothetical protein
MMYQKLLGDDRLYFWMERVDRELANASIQQGCRRCQGRLHQAKYPRKPRGAGCKLGPEFEQRWSFCCAHRECRRRMTPPSVRFFGRRVYFGAVFVLCMAMEHGLRNGRSQRLWELLGVGRQTLERWRTYWQQTFVQSPFWRTARARLSPLVAENELPASLLDRFAGEPMQQLILMLQFVAPLTTGSAGPVAGGS